MKPNTQLISTQKKLFSNEHVEKYGTFSLQVTQEMHIKGAQYYFLNNYCTIPLFVYQIR